MSREIKFRARHKETGKWYYGSSLYTDFRTPSDYILPLSAFWQQVERGSLDTETIGEYTGLKDKNGKEIYEGDIIETQYSQVKPLVMIFRDGGFCPSGDYATETKGLGLIPDNSLCGEAKVIGNIYQNPKLKDML